MPKPYDNLFLQIANFQALIKAAQKAVLGKRNKPGAAKFMANLEKECLALEHELQTGSYQPGRYKIIHIKSPKNAWFLPPRFVTALSIMRYVR